MSATTLSHKPLPAEGESHHQNWYAVMLSAELPVARIVGAEFLGMRVIAYRKPDGAPVVLSAQCPHLGADLAEGDLCGEEVQCAYHHFRFGANGRCTWVPDSCPIPPAARLQAYPAIERLGLIWAFNGSQPLFDPPTFPAYDGPVIAQARRGPIVPIEPYLAIANTYDYVHLRELHGVRMDRRHSSDIRKLNPYVWETDALWEMPGVGEMCVRARTYGTNVMISNFSVGERNDLSGSTCTPLGSNRAQAYEFIAVPDTRDGTAANDEQIAKQFAANWAWVDQLVKDDYRVFRSWRYHRGTLLATDALLVQWLNFAESYPRSMSSEAASAS